MEIAILEWTEVITKCDKKKPPRKPIGFKTYEDGK